MCIRDRIGTHVEFYVNPFYCINFSGNNLSVFQPVCFADVCNPCYPDNCPVSSTHLDVYKRQTSVFYFGLLTGATLGGNLTPIGASANIAAIGILRKNCLLYTSSG